MIKGNWLTGEKPARNLVPPVGPEGHADGRFFRPPSLHPSSANHDGTRLFLQEALKETIFPAAKRGYP
jgi:hypothetical protein